MLSLRLEYKYLAQLSLTWHGRKIRKVDKCNQTGIKNPVQLSIAWRLGEMNKTTPDESGVSGVV
jgi:hypothetical protein